MENFDQPLDVGIPSGGNDGLQITDEVKTYWSQIGKWALFFAILLFVLYGLVVLLGLLAAFNGGSGGFVAAIFIIAVYTALMYFPALYYYRFSTQMKAALNMNDNSMLESAFINLRRFYFYTGVLTIIILALYIVFFMIFGIALMRGGMPMD